MVNKFHDEFEQMEIWWRFEIDQTYYEMQSCLEDVTAESLAMKLQNLYKLSDRISLFELCEICNDYLQRPNESYWWWFYEQITLH